MSQTRLMSLAEALANVIAGYAVAVATQFAVFPLVGIEIRTGQMLIVGLAFTAVSIVRGYLLRRWFDAFARRQARHARTQTKA